MEESPKPKKKLQSSIRSYNVDDWLNQNSDDERIIQMMVASLKQSTHGKLTE